MAFIETARPSLPSMQGKAQQFLRQYGSVPQPLAADNIPGVSAATGLGAGGGAGLSRAPTNGTSGNVDVYLGPGFEQTLTVELTFPSAPATLFWSCDFGTFAAANVGTVFTLTFSAVTGIARSEPYHIHYEPSVAR